MLRDVNTTGGPSASYGKLSDPLNVAKTGVYIVEIVLADMIMVGTQYSRLSSAEHYYLSYQGVSFVGHLEPQHLRLCSPNMLRLCPLRYVRGVYHLCCISKLDTPATGTGITYQFTQTTSGEDVFGTECGMLMPLHTYGNIDEQIMLRKMDHLVFHFDTVVWIQSILVWCSDD